MIAQLNTCSCVICSKQFNTHSFHTHYQRVHDGVQSNYKGHSSKASRAAKLAADFKRQEYDRSPNFCTQCNKALSFDTKRNKFCSHSCAAIYNNSRKDYSIHKPGPTKFVGPKLPKSSSTVDATGTFTKVKPCEICNTLHPKVGKTCSTQCKNKLLKKLVNARMDAGWNPQENRNRSTPSYLERSFKHWLIAVGITDFVQNKTFRCGQKIYYGDFYFPSKGVLIELDGSQHLKTAEYDALRDIDIKQYHNVDTVRITHTEYVTKTKQALVERILK